MTGVQFSIIFLLVLTIGVFAYWRHALVVHRRRIDRLDVRVHVNGIRGKSTVTRLVAAVLREGGYVTVAKTTGSAARVIDPRGAETVVARRGAATINEQVDVVREHVTSGVEALVIECMAVRPLYQEYSQDRIVRSDITIITNVREDHQEEMGETLEEIADSMSLTIPRGGVLICAEHRPYLRERLRRNAEARGSRFVYADPAQVLDEDLHGFDYLQFKENIAIGLTVARLLNIDRQAALHGMWTSVPDLGVLRLEHYELDGKRLLWVPMFAANDRESVIATFELLAPRFPPGATVIGILNNRLDRGRRAELFAEMVPEDLSGRLDHVITFGAYEDAVTRAMVERGFPADRVHNLGDTRNPSLAEILDEITWMIEGAEGVLIGLANIHTHQAELLMDHLARLRGGSRLEEIEESQDPARFPPASRRLLSAESRRPRARDRGDA